MKKIILTLFSVLLTFIIQAQTSYKATLTEMYTWGGRVYFSPSKKTIDV